MRVYLSSTFEDLQGYRAAVFAALEKAGLDVARMEAYTAADARPLDLCLHDVGQSDIYIGLFAWRYGYEPPAEHGNPRARSITELEYRQAERANLRKLLFFAHPDTKAGWPDHFKDDVTGQGDRGKKLKAFLTELGVEKSTSFFHTPDELATLVLAAIMRSGVSGRAYNIPPLVPGFVPRPNLTRAIVDSLLGPRDAHGVSTLVQGAGGFGKTTLAIHACHQPEVIKAFPDGLLWVTLGERPNLATELSNLHRLATGNEPVVAGVVEIGKAVVRTLMGRRCLVVVDDAWRSDDLAPFLSFDGPLLLVTTRIRSLAQEARQSEWSEVPVDEMETGEAATLLGRGLALEHQTRKALHLLADRLGCWPLLLDLVNARLLEEQKARRGHVAECIERVTTVFERKGVLGFDRRDSSARTTAVKRSVDVGLERADEMVPGLSEKAAQISIFPEHVPIPERVLADLWAMDEFDVEEEALRPLDNLSIVRWDREAGEVGLQDVIRLALAARLAEPTTVHQRLLDAWPDPCHLPHRYAWRWFGWHCLRAHELRRLQRLLLDVDWLRAKLSATDINALLEEFDHVQPDRQSDVLQSALRLSAHVLAKRQSQMAGQLLARIPEHESELRGRVLESIRATREAWLRPLRPSLASAGGPLLRTLEGHAGPVTAVALTRDGTRAVSAGGDRTLKIWDLERGEPLRTLTGHEDWVSAVALTPDGSRAVSASGDCTLKIWDLERGEPLHTLAGHAAWVSAVALTPDGTRAVSASGDCTLKIWDLERAEPLRTLEGHAGPVTAVALTADGTRAVSASGDRTLKIWDLERGEALRTLAGHAGSVTAVALTRDGTRAVSASGDCTLRIWDLERGEVVHTLVGHTGPVTAVALTPGGNRAVSAGGDRTLRIWDLERGEAVRPLEGHAGPVTAVALTPDGTRAVSASADRTLKIWDLERDEPRRSLEGHAGPVTAVALTQDGTRAVSASGDRTLKVWDLERGEALRTLAGHAGPVTAVALTRDGTRAVSASGDCTLKVWDLERGEALHSLEGHAGPVSAVALTPDDTRAVSTSGDCTLKVWDLERGELLRTLVGHAAWVSAVALARDGTRVISASGDRTLKIWDPGCSEPLRTLEAHTGPVTVVALTTDGTRAVSASWDRTLKIWDLERGETPRTLAGHAGSVSAVALTTDGTRAVSASLDRTLRIWDLERGEALRTLEGHSSGVSALALTPDGTRAVSASADRSLAVWDLDTGEILATFGVDSPVSSVAVVPGGRMIVAGDDEGRVHFLLLENDRVT